VTTALAFLAALVLIAIPVVMRRAERDVTEFANMTGDES